MKRNYTTPHVEPVLLRTSSVMAADEFNIPVSGKSKDPEAKKYDFNEDDDAAWESADNNIWDN